MLETLVTIDRVIFYLINDTLQNGLFDAVLPWLRNKYFWIPLYIALVAFLGFKFKKKSLLIVFLALLTVAASDIISAKVIKPVFHRARPCNNIEVKDFVHLRVDCGSGYSFVSSHASNHFALALFFIFLFYKRHRWFWWAALLWAGAISYAQVYVGVHYPIDIFAGALLGIAIGGVIGYVNMRLTEPEPEA